MSVVEEFSDSFGNSADTEFTRKQMRKSLTFNIQRKYKWITEDELDTIVDTIMATHGLGKDNFNGLKSLQGLIGNNINDVSIDDNSNKNEKTMAGIYSEVNAPVKKLAGYDFLYRVMKELYGKRKAKRLTGEMLDFSLGIGDSSNIMIPYCYAMNASMLVTTGRDFGLLQSKPCKRIDSYISALCETIHQMSSHLAGAIAVGTLFFDMTHLALLKMDIPLWAVKNNPKARKKFEGEMQQFVHSVNHLSRNSVESPFTNISLFDKTKIAHIIKEDLNWYFPQPEGDYRSPEEWINYCTAYVWELQCIFLDFFDKGDPVKAGMPYRFPVVTYSLTKNKDREIVDEEALEKLVNLDVYRYNIFSSEGSKVASCCRLVNDFEMLELAGQSNSFGAGALASIGSHRVVTINFNRIALEAESMDDFWRIYKYRTEGARDILIAHKKLIKLLAEAHLQPFITNGWINLNRLFSTVGILGIYECVETLKSRFGVGEEIKEEILSLLNKRVIRYTKENAGIIMNIEQIPAESFAVRLAKTDKLLFSEEAVPYELYANQFIPLWEDCSIWERLDADGKYNQLLTGGGIVHATIGEKVSPEQARAIIEYATKVGSEHLALNAIYSQCENEHMTMGDINECPECGGLITDKLTRVVGFFTPVSSWNKTRKEWEFPKRTKVDLTQEEVTIDPDITKDVIRDTDCKIA